MRPRLLLMLALCVTVLLLAAPVAGATPSFDQAVNQLIAKGYPQATEDYLTGLGTSPLGFRFSGSPSDNAAARHIAKRLRDMGLVGVRLEAVPTDVWDFRGASVQAGDREMAASIFSGSPPTPRGGISGEIVYVGAGSASDYGDVDVTGKIVLVDFLPSSWWMDMPVAEAELHGARAVIATRTPADPLYFGVQPDALGIFDVTYYSLSEPPLVFVSQQDSEWLKAQITAGAVTGTVRNAVRMRLAEDGGVGYNVLGVLPGTRHDGQKILFTSHHDAFFSGGLDDSSADAAMLTIAKAMRMSGYRPQRSIVFLFTTGEEFGSMRAYYQWAHGSWHAITQRHPDWAGKITAMLNLEMQGSRGGTVIARMNPELQPWVEKRIADWPAFFPNGSSVITPVDTWNDQWPFTAAGVPSIEFSTKTTDYTATVYHTQYDTKDLIDWSFLGSNAKLYYRLARDLDRGLLPYSLKARADDLATTVDESELIAAGADDDVVARLVAQVQAFRAAADDYETARATFPSSEIRQANATLLSLEKTINSNFTALSVWDKTIYPHQQVLWNVQSLEQAIGALQPVPDPLAAFNALAYVGTTWFGLNFSYDVYKESLSWHDPGFPYLYWGAQGQLARYLDVMPQWQMVIDGQYAQAAADLQTMRDDEVTELNSRLRAITRVLREVTPRIRMLL